MRYSIDLMKGVRKISNTRRTHRSRLPRTIADSHDNLPKSRLEPHLAIQIEASIFASVARISPLSFHAIRSPPDTGAAPIIRTSTSTARKYAGA